MRISPHTAAKHLLLTRYLDRWFPILGRYQRRINYVDGFAGPGRYAGGEMGSPILAINSAAAHVSRGTLSPDVTVNFIFIEDRKARADQLRDELPKLAIPSQFQIRVIDGTFAGQVNHLLDELETDGETLAPTFAFVDPFGFSGIPFDIMRRILAYRRCEVFINVMVDFINRFLEHPNEDVVRHFPETFGTNEVIAIPQRAGNRVEQILALYRRQLESLARYVGRFDMRGQTDRKTYSLFFATNELKGFEKMKEAMWSVDRISGSQFSDAYAAQASLFETMSADPLWDQLMVRFRGQTVTMTELERFVIMETDYTRSHIRPILRERESRGEISVIGPSGYKRPKGTYKSDIVRIEFR